MGNLVRREKFRVILVDSDILRDLLRDFLLITGQHDCPFYTGPLQFGNGFL